VCDGCGTIHYQNPKLVVGCIPEWKDNILLCRRAIEPRLGKWTLPAGYLENGETVTEGAIRETLEEACARVEIVAPYSLLSITHISQIYIFFRARLQDTNFSPGKESSNVRLFSESEIPWDELAFAVVIKTLKCYFKDRLNGIFPVHTGTIFPTDSSHWNR
jgi:ADP-ribose pyrophosphatase YjhB (NUDIX family)